jgi:hypothetical protein
MKRCVVATLVMLTFQLVSYGSAVLSDEPLAAHPANTWIKRTPLNGGPVSPRLGYEGACVWDSRRQLLVRYGGHNQGGGGEQGAEVWTFDLGAGRWQLKEPNTSPPGVCCNAQNVYDTASGRYIRFPLFSGSHGWQWQRELYLNDSSVWTYDLANNRWRNMRPLPAPRLAPYRCASWDSDEHVVVVFGGEGGQDGTLIYDPSRNEWRWPKPTGEPPSRSGGNMAYDEANKLHVLFGAQFIDDPHTWTYSVERNQWRDMQPASMPPTDKNDAVLTYDPINQVTLAIVKITTGDGDSARHEVQTWAYNAGANTWTRMQPAVEPDAAGNRTRNLIFAPEMNLAILENCTSRPREQQVWTYRYAAAQNTDLPPKQERHTIPTIVEDVVAVVSSPSRIELSWSASGDVTNVGYHVERAAVEVWSDDQLVRLKKNTPPLASPSVGAIRKIGPFKQLTAKPVRAMSFVDETIDLLKPQQVEGEPVLDSPLHAEHLDRSGRDYPFAVFAYRILAVHAGGDVSGPSPPCFTIPSSPQQLFSREQGTTCELKWAANPEAKLTGYRVYRLDGRWANDPVSRMTADPITATRFADATAGEHTRRYYVVAVDAIGQEGFPSSPVWFQREWRAYYTPFVGEWHQ